MISTLFPYCNETRCSNFILNLLLTLSEYSKKKTYLTRSYVCLKSLKIYCQTVCSIRKLCHYWLHRPKTIRSIKSTLCENHLYLVLVIVLILKLVLYLNSSLIVTISFPRAKVRGYNAVLYQEQKVPLRGTIIFSFCGPKVPTYTTYSFFVPVDLGQEKVAEELFVFGTEGFKVAVVVFAC